MFMGSDGSVLIIGRFMESLLVGTNFSGGILFMRWISFASYEMELQFPLFFIYMNLVFLSQNYSIRV